MKQATLFVQVRNYQTYIVSHIWFQTLSSPCPTASQGQNHADAPADAHAFKHKHSWVSATHSSYP